MSEETNYELNQDIHMENIITNSYHNVLHIDSVKKWLKNPMHFNRELRMASRTLYNSNGIYSNVIDYMVSLPTLDRVVFSHDREKRGFEAKRKKFYQALDNIKDKVLLRDNLFKNALEGVSFYYFETTENKALPKYLSDYDKEQLEINSKISASLLPLPTDYCEIVGTVNSSFVVAFDLAYFDQYTGNGRSQKLKRYPKEIRDGFVKYNKDRTKRWLVLNNDRTVATKVRAKMDEKWGRPIGISAFNDMLYDEYMTDTKRETLNKINSTIVYQTFPEGEKKGQSSLTQKQQKAQHDNIKNALFTSGKTKGLSFFSVASGTKLDQIKNDIEILNVKSEEEMIRKITTNLGFAGSLLNAESGNFSSQKSNLDMLTSEIMGWIEQWQEELNKVINANIVNDPNIHIKVDYLPLTYANRKEMANMAKELYNSGGSMATWIASIGLNPESYFAMMEEERENEIHEKFPPPQTAHTQSGRDGNGGRPLNNDTDNPNTTKAKNSGVNPVD